MSPEEGLKAAADTAQAVMAIREGRYVDAARHAIDAALELVPAHEAAKLLDEAAIRRANAIADAAEFKKFHLDALDDAGDEPTNPGR